MESFRFGTVPFWESRGGPPGGVLRKDVILKRFGDVLMQGCDSEGVADGSEREDFRNLSFTEHDNAKVTICQEVFTLQVIRIAHELLVCSYILAGRFSTSNWSALVKDIAPL
jgi:hypothetical protein